MSLLDIGYWANYGAIQCLAEWKKEGKTLTEYVCLQNIENRIMSDITVKFDDGTSKIVKKYTHAWFKLT